MVRRKITTIWSVLLAGFLGNAVFFLYVNHFHEAGPARVARLANGALFPIGSGRDTSGRSVEWRGHWALIVSAVVTSEDGIRDIRYADVLSRRFRDSGLAVVAFLRGDDQQIRQFVENGRLSFSVISDGDGAWAGLMGVAADPLGVFLIDPENKVRFGQTYVRPDDLRQLVEKNLLGAVSYQTPGQSAALKVGQPFPPIVVDDLQSGKRVILNDASEKVMVLFTAQCPACSLDSYLKTYSELEQRLEKHSGPPLLVFSSKFSGSTITEAVGGLNVKAKLYLAQTGIDGVEDEYYLSDFFPEGILVAETDANGVVRSMEPLEAVATNSQRQKYVENN